MTDIREINFDMDGTIADLYGVDGWLDDLLNENIRPYEIAKPLLNLQALARVLNNKKKQGYTIKVISWLSKKGSKEYNEMVTKAKMEWLKKHLTSVEWDEIIIVPYGTPKQLLGKGILFDDEENNRKNWNGQAYDVQNIIETIKGLK